VTTTPSAGTPRQPLQGSLQELNRRKRGFTFTAAISVLAIFLLLPILAAFTPILDPIVFSGISLAYLFGFAMFVVALVVAHIYQSRAKHLDVLTERARAEIRERGEP
jgi:uncharacterized membrane protein (DUF485 family)